MEPRKKSTVTVLYSYSYSTSNGDIQVTEGERLILIDKSTEEWWQVRRPGDKNQAFYAPANYLHEDGKNRKATKSDESLLTRPFSKATGKWSARLVNAELKKSTSMDAVMFLDMLENEAKQEVNKMKSESLADKFKKPRISKDLWERRKSWAVEEATAAAAVAPVTKRDKRHSIAPPLPPRHLSSDKRDVVADSKSRDKTESKAPALPPKRSGGSKSSSPDHYSRVIAVRSSTMACSSGGGGGGKLTSSLERLAEQIGGPPLSYPHPVPPPRRDGKAEKNVRQETTATKATTTTTGATTAGTTVVVVNDCPPKLPPKMAKGAPPMPLPRGGSQLVNRNFKETLKDNYVNLLRPVTVVDSIDDIQSDESGINMSFNNPLFTEREDAATPADADEHQQERSNSFNDLDSSSIDERVRLNGSSSSHVLGGSESNLSGELDVTYDASSSGEDLLSSKDSINSIPSLKSEQRQTASLTKKPPDSPPPHERAQRELYEGWHEYRDRSSGRPFYYNRETRAKSWKPPRKRGPSPMIRGLAIEEEPTREVGGAGARSCPIAAAAGQSPEPVQLSSSVDSLGRQSTTDDDVDTASSSRSSLQRRRQVVADAVRSKKLPPAPPGWQEILDGDDVVYVNSKTKARWYTSLDAEGRIYYYEEDSNESLWALPNIAADPEPDHVATAAAKLAKEQEEQELREREEELDRPTELNITPTVYYPEGSLAPEMDKSVRLAPPSTTTTTTMTPSTTSASGWSIGRSRASKADRAAKSRSMVLTNFTGRVEDAPLEAAASALATGAVGIGLGVGADSAIAKTASLPRNIQQPQWPTLQGGSIRVLKQGILQKTKLTENGKKVRKSWSSSWVVLTDLFLFLFKESAAKASLSSSPSGSTLESATGKIELCVDLNGATIEWAAVKSSRKGVFQVSTLLGVQLLLQDEDETNVVVWFNEIKKAISRLPHSGALQESMTRQYQPVNVSKFKKSPLTKTKSSFANSSPSSDRRMFDRYTPPSPTSPTESFGASFSSKKLSKLQRTRSTKVPFLGSTEDLTSPNPERQVKLRDKLRKFFVRRPPVDALVKKGIYKDEPVFGCYLGDLCAFDKSPVPRFVQRVIQLIESKPENMKADGIYRASGNLSQIQKLRCHVDQYKWSILEIEEDVHALTGCLKLFFRELKEPLIPFPLIEQALKAALYQGPQSERVRRYREVIDALPVANYETLKYLLGHLLNITEYREFNRMQISNLAIVFGPTLMWTATASNNLALDMMQQNIVVEALLNHYKEIFVR